MASPNMCSKSWITNQYDRYVQGNTALSMPDDGGVVRVDENTNLGVALATDAPRVSPTWIRTRVLARPWLKRTVTLRPSVHAPWLCLTA